jgi:hypothetical protein
MESNELSVIELKILQDVIARHEQMAFRVKEWFSIIISGLAFLLYSKPGLIPLNEYIVICLMILLSFSVWLIFHRGIVDLSIDRIKEIELYLRNSSTSKEKSEAYNGPLLCESLSKSIFRDRMICRLIKDPQVCLPSGIVIVVLIAVGFLFFPSLPDNSLPYVNHQTESDFCVSNINDTCSSLSPVATEHPIPIDGLIWISILLICVGFALVLWGRAIAKVMGVISLLCGAQVAVVKEFKLDKIFSIETTSETNEEKLSLLVKKDIQSLIQNLHISSLGPRNLGEIKNFRPGFSSIDHEGFEAKDLKSAKEMLDNICVDLGKSLGSSNNMIMIIGAVDRLPLASNTRLRYESNLGLARARAEAVKEYLSKNCKNQLSEKGNQDNIITLASGPRNTPEVLGDMPYDGFNGFPEDRRVDVWIFQHIPEISVINQEKQSTDATGLESIVD